MSQSSVSTADISPNYMSHDELVQAAKDLVPLLREKARETEEVRRPVPEVMEAVRASGLLSMMVPREYGGHAADIDTFFEVSLILSRVDASMGWLICFYIEHNFWIQAYPKEVREEVYKDKPYTLTPVNLFAAGGGAKPVEGGFRLSGQWSWATCVTDADYVMPIAMVEGGEPLLFLLPIDQVEIIDNWHVSGMAGTGSLDYKINDVFVPESHTISMLPFFIERDDSPLPFDEPIFQTPMSPTLGFVVANSVLGAAQGALEAWQESTKAKLKKGEARLGEVPGDSPKFSVAAKTALTLETVEILYRDILREVMEKRYNSSVDERASWLVRISHGMFMARDAMQDLMSIAGASGGRLDSPIQKAMRDIQIASNHGFLDRENRYAEYGRLITGLPMGAGWA